MAQMPFVTPTVSICQEHQYLSQYLESKSFKQVLQVFTQTEIAFKVEIFFFPLI